MSRSLIKSTFIDWSGGDGVPNSLSTASTRAAIKSLNPDNIHAVFLTENRRAGTFVWRAGDYSDLVTADTAEGIFIAHETIPTTSGAWIRETNGDWWARWFGTPALADVDAAPALTAAFNLFNLDWSLDVYNVHCRRFIIDQYYHLESELPVVDRQIAIRGSGHHSRCGFNKHYVASGGNRGILSYTTYGPDIADLHIRATGGSGGCGVAWVLPGPGVGSGRGHIAALEVSCGDYVNYTLYLHGNNATNPGGGKGLRSLFINDSIFFGSAGYAVALAGVKYLSAANCQIGTAGGSGTVGMLVSGTSEVPSEEIAWHGFISGQLFVEHTSNSRFVGNAYGSVTFASTASNCWLEGSALAGVTNNGTNCGVR